MASKKNEKTSEISINSFSSLWDYNPNNTSNSNQKYKRSSIKKPSIKNNINNLKPSIHLEKEPIENITKNNQIIVEKSEPIKVELEENQSMKKRSEKKKITKWDSDSDDCEENESIPIKSNDSPKLDSESDSDDNDSTLISFKINPANDIRTRYKKVTFWDSD
jgi:hypothetical protein